MLGYIFLKTLPDSAAWYFFHKCVRNESNSLKVNLDFPSTILTNKTESKIELASYWLHGAPAKKLKTKTILFQILVKKL